MPKFFALPCLVLLAMATSAKAQFPMSCGEWVPVADADGLSVDNTIRAMAVFDDGGGPKLYVGGEFQSAGGVRSPNIARWDGERWSPLPGLDGAGRELDGFVLELKVIEDGDGPALYVGGQFTHAAGIEMNRIARFDGQDWTPLQGGTGVGVDGSVGSIHTHDFGDGPKLYVGGNFTRAGGVEATRLARWDGQAWTAVGDGAGPDRHVTDLASFQGDLYVSGYFQEVAGIAAPGIARWDGASWSHPVGPGERIVSQEIWPLATWDDGAGERLYAGGRFGAPDGSGFAWWDGQQWDGLGDRVRVAQQVGDLLPFDDGFGEALYLSGNMYNRTGDAVGRVRDGTIEALQGSPRNFGFQMAVYDSGDGPSLHVAGSFRSLSFGQSGYLAYWRPKPCPIDMNSDCHVDVRDFWEFRLRFAAGDDRADFDADGSLTIFDMLAYQNAFDAGCP
jgi:hypothetical protein